MQNKNKNLVWFGLLETDPSSEKRVTNFYVPRDECFSEVKHLTFSTKALFSVLLILLPSLGRLMSHKDIEFSYFHDIDSLFSIGLELPSHHPGEFEKGLLNAIMPRLVKSISGSNGAGGNVLRFEPPEAMSSQISSSIIIHYIIRKRPLDAPKFQLCP